MALNNDATLVVEAGNYLTAPASTPLPTELKTPGEPWENIGHTAIDEILSLTSEGGEAQVLATLQNRSLRTSYSTRTEAFTFTLQQFDEAALKLYYGSNMVDLADGTLGVPTNGRPTVAAFLAVFVDGDNVFAFYAPKAEIFRGEDIALSDTETLAGLPLRVTPMVDGNNTWAYAVTPLGSA